MQGCTLGDNPTGQYLQDTYREIDIEKSGVLGYCGRNNSLSLRDEHGRVFLPPDASHRLTLDGFEEVLN